MTSLTRRTIGKYDIRETLGKGDMATARLGYQASADRSVVIKALPPHPGLDAAIIERFRIVPTGAEQVA